MPDLPIILRFNFHNSVAVEVKANHPADAVFFASEYALHQVQELPADVQTVSLSIQRWQTLDRVPAGYTIHTHKFLARWAYQLAIENARIKIDVIANRLAVPMVHHMLLHPSLRYLAANNNLMMLHAGAVVSHEQSLILTGYGGAGKTTTTSLLLDAGGDNWLPHADDYVFLRSGPKSLAYLTRSHLYLNLLDWVPDIRHRLTASERWQLFFWGKLRAWSKENIKWPVRLPMERLWPSRRIVDEAIPAGLVLLKRTATTEPLLSTLIADDALVDELIAMNFGEARHFLALIEKSQSVPDFPNWQAAWRDRERHLLNRSLAEIPVYLLELPHTHDTAATYRQSVTAQLMSLLQKVE